MLLNTKLHSNVVVSIKSFNIDHFEDSNDGVKIYIISFHRKQSYLCFSISFNIIFLLCKHSYSPFLNDEILLSVVINMLKECEKLISANYFKKS